MAYRAARLLHLAVTVAVIPVGLWHWQRTHVDAGAAVRVVVFLAVTFLSLFVVAFDQADYPTKLRGALFKTAPLLVSTGAALAFHLDDPTAAAAWPLSSLALAFALTL